MTTSVTTNSEDSALWEAFRYVAGEMTPGETEAFESRLQTDDQLCESVITATRLTCVCSDIPDVRPTEDSTSTLSKDDKISGFSRSGRPVAFSHRVLVVVISVACCLLLIITGYTVDSEESLELLVQNTSESTGAVYDAEQLVTLWNSDSSVLPGDDVVENEEASEFELATDVEIPSWIVAAVSLDSASNLPEPDNQVEEKSPELF